MKKRMLIAAAAVLFVIVAAVVLLPSNTTPPDPSTGAATTTGSTADTTMPTVKPTTSVVVTPTGTTVITLPPPTTTLPPEPGVVRLYTCDAAQYEAYLALAAEYYGETGIEVLVLTPAEGETCEAALTRLLAGENAPSLFCVHSRQMLEQLQLYDLTDSAVAAQLYGPAFAQSVDGNMVALSMDVGGSGLIYNASKLAIAGFSESDISSFAALKVTVSYLTANKSELGYAFAAPDYTDEHLMEHLAGLYPDADQLRAFFDMYLKNCTAKTTTLKYFTNGTTVFYIGGTAEYEKVASLGSNNLRFMPAYSQDTAMVQCFSSLYWAVNADVSDADIQETLDFWAWLVTAQADAAPIDRLGMLSPYQQATHADNILEKKLREYITDGDAYVTWNLSGNVTDLEAFTAALKAYAASQTDENWAAVAATFG